MKKAMILIFPLITATTIMAQQGRDVPLAGTVIYEEVIQLDIQLEGDAAQLAHALPRERTSQKILYFTEGAALYENHRVEDPAEDMGMEDESQVIIKMHEPDNRTYTDLENKQSIRQKDFMSRLFLIESETAGGDWKLTGNRKMILDYPCQEAISQLDDNEVYAWFTPQIPVSAGPAAFGNLPGLILAVDMDGGKRRIQALSVKMGPVDKTLMKKPSKGKKVTEEEFHAIVDEKMKEMGAEPGSGSTGHATVVVKIKQ